MIFSGNYQVLAFTAVEYSKFCCIVAARSLGDKVMNGALEQFLARLQKEGRPTEVQKDKDGVEFIETDVIGLRKYQSDFLNLVKFRCIGYVSIKLRGSKNLARICPPLEE